MGTNAGPFDGVGVKEGGNDGCCDGLPAVRAKEIDGTSEFTSDGVFDSCIDGRIDCDERTGGELEAVGASEPTSEGLLDGPIDGGIIDCDETTEGALDAVGVSESAPDGVFELCTDGCIDCDETIEGACDGVPIVGPSETDGASESTSDAGRLSSALTAASIAKTP